MQKGRQKASEEMSIVTYSDDLNFDDAVKLLEEAILNEFNENSDEHKLFDKIIGGCNNLHKINSELMREVNSLNKTIKFLTAQKEDIARYLQDIVAQMKDK